LKAVHANLRRCEVASAINNYASVSNWPPETAKKNASAARMNLIEGANIASCGHDLPGLSLNLLMMQSEGHRASGCFREAKPPLECPNERES
jgi:hypothetical protein